MAHLKTHILNALWIIIFTSQIIQAQDTVKLYNPTADAKAQIKLAVEQAALENKHVFLQVGGNWCPWCLRLHDFIETNPTLDSIINADYVIVHLNYSKENKNLDVMESLGFPQRFGFPVLVILDANGNRLHTQDTGLLESDKSYDADKIKTVLLGWNTNAMDSLKYLPPKQ
jgi:thioredoxin-related protein